VIANTGGAVMARFAGPGGLQLEDEQQHTKFALYAHAGAARVLAATAGDGGWIVAGFEDGTLWRKHLAANTAGELALEPPRAGLPLVVTEDGTAVFAVTSGRADAGGPSELRAWRPDGRVDVLAGPLASVVALALVDDGRVLALAEDGVRVVDITRAAPLSAPTGVLARAATLARSGGLVAAPTVAGGVEVVDPLVGWRWPLASPQKGQAPFTVVDIAPDGSRVLASTATEVFVWTLALPPDAEATKAWLARQTNAIADSPSGPLGWQ
jgi:hypothetical protein